MRKVKELYCNYDPNDSLYYCSTKTKYGSQFPELCEFIGNHNGLFEYIENHQDKYEYVLPFLVAHEFEKRLKEGVKKSE